MSKILITADVHLGFPNKLNDVLWSLNTIKLYAQKHGIDNIMVLGDLFHDRVHIDISVLNAAYDFFRETKELGQQWVSFPGNHDMPMRHSWDINSIRPLQDVLTVINDIKLMSVDGHRFWVVPFVHYESVYMKVIADIEEQYQKDDVLLTHIGVHDATLNECFLIKNWSIVTFKGSKFDRVFTGHFHCHQKVGDNLWYPGSPIPFRFDEGMVPHGFIEYDMETRKVKFVKIFELGLIDGRPPDYVTITDDMVEDCGDIKGDNIRVQLDRDYSRDELMRMRKSLIDRGAISVKLNKLKDEKLDISPEKRSGVSLNDPADLFEKYIEHDKPKKLDLDLLKDLNRSLLIDRR